MSGKALRFLSFAISFLCLTSLAQAQLAILSSPSPLPRGTSVTLTVTATAGAFAATDKIKFNQESGFHATTWVDSAHLRTTITPQDTFNPPAGNLADYAVWVHNAAGTFLAGSVVSYTNPVPLSTSLNPPAAIAGSGAFALTVNGLGFINTTSVLWNSQARTVTSASPTQLLVAINSGDVAATGTASVAVSNPTPGGGSSSVPFTISPPCSYSLSSAGQSFPSSGGSGTVAVTVGNGCAWTAVSNAAWIMIVSGGSGSGNGTAGYLVSASASQSSRSGTLTIAGAAFTISQAGAPPAAPAGLNPPDGASGIDLNPTLSWSPVSGAASYDVYFGTTSPPPLTGNTPGNSISVPSTLQIATAYYWSVTAKNSNGSSSSGIAQFTTVGGSNQAPVLAALHPVSVTAGGSAFTLTVTGTGFSGNSRIRWNGVPQNTSYGSPTVVSATIDRVALAFPGKASVTVSNSTASADLVSNALSLDIQPAGGPMPSLSGMAPLSVIAGGPGFDLQITGSGFSPEATVRWNGADRPTTFLSSRQLRAHISAADLLGPANALLTVSNLGVAASNALQFEVSLPGPEIAAVSPPVLAAGQEPFVLTVSGINFVSGSTIRWNNSDRTTSFVNRGQITTTIQASDVATAGNASLTVVNPDGKLSASFPVQVRAFPTAGARIAAISPARIPAGTGGISLAVSGSGFSPGSVVQWNGQDRPTTFLSASELRVAIPAADVAVPGNFAITISGSSNSSSDSQNAAVALPYAVFEVLSPVPVITRLTPAYATAGDSSFRLVMDGSGFLANVTRVQYNRKQLTASFLNPGQIAIDVPAADVAAAGGINLVVINPGPGGGTTDARWFAIVPRIQVAAELYYPRLSSSGGASVTGQSSENTGIALANLSGREPVLALHALSTQGVEIAGPDIANPVVFSLSNMEQRAAVDSQVFGPGIRAANSLGWMKLQSSERNIAGFFLAFDDSLKTLDGADVSSASARSFVFPEIDVSGFTQIHLVNPGPSTATVTLELRRADGTTRASVTRTVSPGGAAVELLRSLFSGTFPEVTDYVLGSSNQGVVTFEYFGRVGVDNAGLNGRDASQGAAALYSPQYALGGNEKYRTTLSIINLESFPTTVTLRLIGDNGLQIGQTRSALISANGKLSVADDTFFVAPGNNLISGYLEVTDSNSAKLAGSVVFMDSQGSRFASALPLVSSLQTSIVFGQVASGRIGNQNYFTGVALLNPSGIPANVTIELYSSDGQRVVSKTDVIPAAQRKSKLLTEYFAALTGQTIGSGYIRVTSDRGLAGFALFGTDALTSLSAVPAQVGP
jgi:hypothetical protein